MQVSPRRESVGIAGTRVMRKQYYYLDAQIRQQLDEVLRDFAIRRSNGHLWADLCSLLPVEKFKPESLKMRVEGLSYTADALWKMALQRGKEFFGENFDRLSLQRTVRTYPISHYHYLLGSREPRDLVLTRRDGMHDPQVALYKLHNDIQALADFICQTPALQGTDSDQSGLLSN